MRIYASSPYGCADLVQSTRKVIKIGKEVRVEGILSLLIEDLNLYGLTEVHGRGLLHVEDRCIRYSNLEQFQQGSS